jgi:hypothetical protein
LAGGISETIAQYGGLPALADIVRTEGDGDATPEQTQVHDAAAWGLRLLHSRMQMQSKYLGQMYDLYEEDFHLTAMPLLTQEVRGGPLLSEFAARLISSEWRPLIKDG